MTLKMILESKYTNYPDVELEEIKPLSGQTFTECKLPSGEIIFILAPVNLQVMMYFDWVCGRTPMDTNSTFWRLI